MGHIEGKNRYQSKIICFDEYVEAKSMVRLIDKFVDVIDLEGLGFKNVAPNELGRNSYSPSHMVKLYVYGYENGVRSSRKLERLTHKDIEVMWLMDELAPDFKTIADFRKDNIEAMEQLFYEFESFCESAGLIGKRKIAIDGTKLKASNNKKTNYSRKKLAKRIAHNKQRIGEYMEALRNADDLDEAEELHKSIRFCEEQKDKYEGYEKRLDESGANEVSEVDPDARLMGNNRSGVDVAYNLQAAVDSKEHIAVAFDVITNPTDHDQLSSMTEKTQEVFRKRDIIALADKGYWSGADLIKCEALGATAIVSPQKTAGEKDRDRKFRLNRFIYDMENDCYTCPLGHTLLPHSKKNTKTRKFFNKPACTACPCKDGCLPAKSRFRIITRGAFAATLDRAHQRYNCNAELYKLRQQIVEHVFGTVKRTMDGGYLLLRTKRKVRAEAALLLLGYNMKRAKSALGFEQMMAMLDEYGKRVSATAFFLTVATLYKHILQKSINLIVQSNNSPVVV
jgi:transposase